MKLEEKDEVREESPEEAQRARDVARRFAEMQARRAAEQQATQQEADRKREAEALARREKERAEEEERQNRRREEDERRRVAQEQDEQRRQEEEARTREQEEKARAEVEAAALALREARANERAAIQARAEVRELAVEPIAVEPPPRAAPRSSGQPIAVVLFLLLLGGLAAVNFMPLGAPSFEKAAAARFGVPVKIGSVHLSLVPSPALRFERVAIGPQGEVKIAVVKANGGLSTTFDEKKSFKSLEFEGATVPLSWLAAAVWGKAQSDTLRVDQVIARGLKIEAEGLELPAVNVDARLDAGGGLQSLSAETPDRTQTFSMAMKDGKAAIDLSAKLFRLPFPGIVQFDDFAGKGTLAPSELTLSEFNGYALGGVFNGDARLRWGANWSLEGEFAARSVDPARVAAALVSTGRLAGHGTFSMRAATPAGLQDTMRLDGSFTVTKGTLGFVDLTRVLQGSAVPGGTTTFPTMAGNASLSGGSIQVRQVRLVAGLLNATGEASVDPQKKLNGRFQVDMGARSGAALSLGGTSSAPQVRR